MFKRFLLISCLSLFCLISPSQAGQQITPIPDIKIHFSEIPLHLDTPIIEVEKLKYIPIRSFLTQLHAEMSYSRKSDSYTISFKRNDKKLIIFTNSKKYKYNGKTDLWPNQSLKYLGRIYKIGRAHV